MDARTYTSYPSSNMTSSPYGNNVLGRVGGSIAHGSRMYQVFPDMYDLKGRIRETKVNINGVAEFDIALDDQVFINVILCEVVEYFGLHLHPIINHILDHRDFWIDH